MKLPSLPLPPMREKFLNKHANFVLIGMKTAHTHTSSRSCCLCAFAGGEEARYCTVE